jgi:2-oxoglutarate ferredoxin oxidoreductase subunit gamma
MARYEVRIVGFGGQGVITLSKMIAYTSGITGNYLVTQTEAYSAEARGGSAWAEVVIELDKEVKLIDYPKALKPYDVLVILSEIATKDVKRDDLKAEENTGYLIWDSSTIGTFRSAKRMRNLSYPIQKTAVEKFGDSVFGNTILFGMFTQVSKIFSEEAAIKTIKEFVPSSTLDTNLEAFKFGMQTAEELLNKLAEGSS